MIHDEGKNVWTTDGVFEDFTRRNVMEVCAGFSHALDDFWPRKRLLYGCETIERRELAIIGTQTLNGPVQKTLKPRADVGAQVEDQVHDGFAFIAKWGKRVAGIVLWVGNFRIVSHRFEKGIINHMNRLMKPQLLQNVGKEIVVAILIGRFIIFNIGISQLGIQTIFS